MSLSLWTRVSRGGQKNSQRLVRGNWEWEAFANPGPSGARVALLQSLILPPAPQIYRDEP
jgi:hypothetical protein